MIYNVVLVYAVQQSESVIHTHLYPLFFFFFFKEQVIYKLAFYFYLFKHYFIYLWLCWIFVSVRGLSLVVASGGHSSSRCAGPLIIAASPDAQAQ